MKVLLYSTVFCLTTFAAQAQEYFGEKITEEDISSSTELISDLSEQGSLQTKVEGEVTGVCQMKGCWMTVNVGNNQEVMVRFKDYGFFCLRILPVRPS